MLGRGEEPLIKVLGLQAHENGINSSKREKYFSVNLYRQDSLTRETNYDQSH